MRPLTIYAAVLIAITPPAERCERQQQIPIRQLDRIVATCADSLGSIRGVRQLSDGRVLVNDAGDYQLILYDSALHRIKIVADNTDQTAKAYGSRPDELLRYPGDTTLLLDRVAAAFVTVLPSGALGRIFALPETGYGNNASFLRDGFDGKGRLIYFAPPHVTPGPATASCQSCTAVTEDSAYIVRADLGARRIDTIARVKQYSVKIVGVFSWNDARGRNAQLLSVTNPMPVSDDWAVLGDGSLAIVRARDYHVDWIAPDGTPRSTPPMPWRWDRMTDGAKMALIDSLRSHADSVDHGTVKGPPPQFVGADQLPDYRSPFNRGLTVADADGHLWIQIALRPAPAGGLVYDVVNLKGAVVDRVQIPGGTTIVGFGPGMMYLSSRITTRYQLVKVALTWK